MAPQQQHTIAHKAVAAVIGASGMVGSAVVKHLAANGGGFNEIRALARDPSKLADVAGVTNTQGSMSDPAGLTAALQGVTTAFISVPSPKDRAALAIAGAKAAKDAGVAHIAIISVDNAAHPETVFGAQFSEIENAINELGFPMGATFLRCPAFFENHWGSKDTIITQGSMYGPMKNDVKFRSIAVDDIGAAAAGAMGNPSKHGGTTRRISAPLHTRDDVAVAFSEAVGKEVKYVRVPWEAAREGMIGMGFADWQATGLFEIMQLAEEGKEAAVVDGNEDFVALTGRNATTHQQWVDSVAAAFKEVPAKAEEAASDFTPVIYMKAGCPFCTNLAVFLADAGLQRAVQWERDTDENRALVNEYFGKAVAFPVLQYAPGEFMLESGDIIDKLANVHGVDRRSLPVFNFFNEEASNEPAMFKTYIKLFMYGKAIEGEQLMKKIGVGVHDKTYTTVWEKTTSE